MSSPTPRTLQQRRSERKKTEEDEKKKTAEDGTEKSRKTRDSKVND